MAAVFWAVEHVGNDDEDGAGGGVSANNREATAGDSGGTSPVQDYLRFAAALGDRQVQESEGAEYIVEGLRKLAGALGMLNLGGPDLQVDLRVAAEHLLLNSASGATTAVVRNGLISAADAIEAIRGGSLRRLAESIEPDRSLLDQHAVVREFFLESASAIRRFSSSSG